MLREIEIGGLYVAPIAAYLPAGLVLSLGVQAVLGRLGVHRWVWHPALFEAALFVIIVSLLMLLV